MVILGHRMVLHSCQQGDIYQTLLAIRLQISIHHLQEA